MAIVATPVFTSWRNSFARGEPVAYRRRQGDVNVGRLRPASPTATARSGSWTVISPCPGTAPFDRILLPLQDPASIVDRYRHQGHAHRPGHVLESVGGQNSVRLS